jgi:hypothetical protein
MATPKEIDVVRRAYELWQEAGQPHGKDEEFYHQAKKELQDALDNECPAGNNRERHPKDVPANHGTYVPRLQPIYSEGDQRAGADPEPLSSPGRSALAAAAFHMPPAD